MGKFGDHRVAVEGPCQGEMVGRLVLTEIGRLKQFRQQDNVRRPGMSPADHVLCFCDVGGTIPSAGELYGRQSDRRHAVGSCWVMQWMPPPPCTISSASICMMSRPGKHCARMVRAVSSFGSSKPGITTAPFAR